MTSPTKGTGLGKDKIMEISLKVIHADSLLLPIYPILKKFANEKRKKMEDLLPEINNYLSDVGFELVKFPINEAIKLLGSKEEKVGFSGLRLESNPIREHDQMSVYMEVLVTFIERFGFLDQETGTKWLSEQELLEHTAQCCPFSTNRMISR
jgi:hypothetical protein